MRGKELLLFVEGLGYESKATGIDKGDALMFSFDNWKTDSVEVDIRLLPNHPVRGDQLRFSISLDDAAPEMISYETKGRSEEWKENVLRNQAIRTVRLPVSGKKSHKIGNQGIGRRSDIRPGDALYAFAYW